MFLNCPPRLGKNLKFTYLKWLKMLVHCSPWLEKNVKFTSLKWLTHAKTQETKKILTINCRNTEKYRKYPIIQKNTESHEIQKYRKYRKIQMTSQSA